MMTMHRRNRNLPRASGATFLTATQLLANSLSPLPTVDNFYRLRNHDFEPQKCIH
jgi:hypothetical protein